MQRREATVRTSCTVSRKTKKVGQFLCPTSLLMVNVLSQTPYTLIIELIEEDALEKEVSSLLGELIVELKL